MVLLLAHRHQILSFIAKQLVNANDVEDVFQKTSLLLWKKMDQFDPNRSFLNWAFGIAFNEVRNHIRIKSRDKLHFDRELVELLAREAEQESDISLARRQALGRCIDQLSDVHRALIRQCYLNSKSITEVAESGGLSRGALYKKLARIKQKLAQCVQKQLSTEGGLP